MKKINSINELKNIIMNMKIDLRYSRNIKYKMNNLHLGSIDSAEQIINFILNKKLKGETKFIIEIYYEQYEDITKKCAIDTKNDVPIIQCLMNMLEEYGIYVDEDELPNGMLDEYIKSTKDILQKYTIEEDTRIKKEIHIDTFDISDIVNVSF